LASSRPPSRPPLEAEYSAGGVVYRTAPSGSGYEIVAVQRARHGDWSLPKGHIEKGETREEAAVREVEEETGIQARILKPIEDIVYFYRRKNGALIRKTVYHFLMEALTQELGGPNWEVSEARWVSLKEAQNLLSYANDKGVVRKAKELLAAGTEQA
jgi:8-oxo-dGTP pyrophosphatase MutT (NUDIX family)